MSDVLLSALESVIETSKYHTIDSDWPSTEFLKKLRQEILDLRFQVTQLEWELESTLMDLDVAKIDYD